MIEYESTRDLETFSKFLDNGGKLPAEEPIAPLPVGVSVPRCPDPGQVGRVAVGLPVAGVIQGCSFQLGLCDPFQETPANASTEPREEL